MFPNNIIGGLGTARRTLTLPRILNGLSKTLGVVNQAIPLYKQAKPMISKGRTLFKLASQINKAEPTKSSPLKPVKETFSQNNSLSSKNLVKNMPVFFQ